MATIYDVPTNALIQEAALELKKQKLVSPTEWSAFVKTGVHKERVPADQDWWYMRAASVLRKVSMIGPVGVSKLRRKYGGRKNRGVKPDVFRPGSGNIIRKILQQLEASKLVENKTNDKNKGRVITAKGSSFLDQAAGRVMKAQKA